jgi:predicted TIM-barrel fold metal-dependent hydrolase
MIGYSIPPEVPAEDFGVHLNEIRAQYLIAAVKVHPNLSNIDLSRGEGVARLEAILTACGSLRLPVVVHGGCSPILGHVPAAEFSALDNLSDVNWSATGHSVVIAHFGIYGCNATKPIVGAIDSLNRLLEKYPNLMVDTAGVSPQIMRSALPLVDRNRVVFGSDALYHSMWQSLVVLADVLAENREGNVIDAISQIAGTNSDRLFG